MISFETQENVFEETLNALNEIYQYNIGRGPNLWGAFNQRTNINFKCPNKNTPTNT